MAVDKNILAAMAIRMSINSAGMAKDINKIKGNMNLLKSSIQQFGGVLAAAFSARAIFNFGKSSFEAYQKQIMQERQLLTALRGRKDIQERLIKQANSLQQRTLFEDDVIMQQQKFLASIGVGEEKINDIMKAAVQLSTALDVDLNMSVKNLAGTLGGTIRELGKYVPALKLLTKEQLMAGEAIKWVNENMKGLAETAADVDPITQARNAWGDIKEQFGKIIAPSVISSAQLWKEWATIMTSELISGWDKFIATISNRKKHELYQMIVPEVDDEETKRFKETISKLKAGTWKPGRFGEDKIVKVTPLLEKANSKLKEYVELWEQATTEQELAIYNRKIQLQEKEIERLKELGRLHEKVQLYDTPAEAGMPVIGGGTSFYKLESNKPEIMPSLPAPDLTMRGEWLAYRQKFIDDYMEMQQILKDINDQFTSAMNEMFRNVAVGFGEMLGNLIATGKGFDANTALMGIANMMQKFGELVISAGIAALGINAALKNLKSAPVAIAAGVALVALSQAVKQGASNISEGGSANISGYGNNQTGGPNNVNIYRQLGDKDLIKIEVTGTISGENIRLSNQRATERHNLGY